MAMTHVTYYVTLKRGRRAARWYITNAVGMTAHHVRSVGSAGYPCGPNGKHRDAPP